METFSALLAICAGNSPVPGEFPTQRPVTRSFDVSFDLRLNKRLSIPDFEGGGGGVTHGVNFHPNRSIRGVRVAQYENFTNISQREWLKTKKWYLTGACLTFEYTTRGCSWGEKNGGTSYWLWQKECPPPPPHTHTHTHTTPPTPPHPTHPWPSANDVALKMKSIGIYLRVQSFF